MAVTDCIRQCRRCGVEFRRTAKGQPTKYCGTECRDAMAGKLPEAKCITCGSSFHPRIGQVFCSYSCRRAPAFIGPRNKKKRSTSKRQMESTCAACGCGFVASYNGGRTGYAKFCSDRCRAAGNKARVRVLLRESRLRIQVRRRKCDGCGKPFTQKESERYCRPECRVSNYQWEPCDRACACCGVEFRTDQRWQRVCSADCHLHLRRKNRRIAKASRKARIKGRRYESIDPIAVFERDGWRCYMCGIATPMELRGTLQPNAPELEHKLALANGGTHTWDNVACACRKCNGLKGASLMPMAA